MSYKYLIIGGGAAGVSAADTIRQNDKDGSIAIVSDEPYMLYSRVMLSKPNFFLGKVPFDQIWMKGEEWYKTNNITFLGGKTAIALDSQKKIVTLNDNSEINYDKLLLATGVDVRKTTVKGSNMNGVHYLRSLEDGKGIMNGIKEAKKAIVVGGGFIGFEMVDLMQLAGLETTLIIRESHFWDPVLDETAGKIIENAMLAKNVKIIRNNEIVEIKGNDNKVSSVVLKDGQNIDCEMIIYGIGTISRLDWLKSCGLIMNRGILANEFLETSLKDVYAAGDIAEYKDLLLEENVIMGNWASAHEQGRVAGLNMVGRKQAFKFISFYTTQGFDLNIAFVGDTSPGTNRQIIARGPTENNSYARLIIVGKELIGATLVNRMQEMGIISKLIEKNVDVSNKISEIADISFDLKTLLE